MDNMINNLNPDTTALLLVVAFFAFLYLCAGVIVIDVWTKINCRRQALPSLKRRAWMVITWVRYFDFCA